MAFLQIAHRSQSALIDDDDYGRCQQHTWRLLPNGYVASHALRSLGIRMLYLHRFVLGDIPAGCEVDHINGDRLDNRRENLRIATRHVNQVNRHKQNNRNKSGVRGVSWDRRERKWAVHICLHRKHIGLGTFRTIEEATAVRRAAELRYFGEYCPIPAGQST